MHTANKEFIILNEKYQIMNISSYQNKIFDIKAKLTLTFLWKLEEVEYN